MSKIISSASVAEVFPSGQKITGVIVEYDCAIDPSSISNMSFDVKNRTVTGISLCEDNPCAVWINLDPSDETAATVKFPHRPHPEDGDHGGDPGKIPTVSLPSPKKIHYKICEQVVQDLDIMSAGGEIIPGDGRAFLTEREVQLISDDFHKLTYHDPVSGEDLMYNLFIPEEYDGIVNLPIVMFIPDAGGCSDIHDLSIVYTYGGIVFASPEEQRKHPSFVLVPQVPSGPSLTNDDFECTGLVDSILRLLDEIIERFSIDKNRVYTTGQSMGCMASCEMLLRRPELFAGALLVAGQWDPERMGVLTDQNMWIVVSEGDEKAYPIMNEVISNILEHGGHVTEGVWDAHMPSDKLRNEAGRMISEGNHILHTVLTRESVGLGENSPGAQHSNTWRLVYPMEPLRDWLFDQRKKV